MNHDWSRGEVEEAITSALELLDIDDSDLLEYDSSERSITHRLAVYLERIFVGLKVDCEYNRRGINGLPKRVYMNKDKYHLENLGIDSADTVLPDIVIHSRGIDSENLLVIEVKKDKGKVDLEGHLRDKDKLAAYKREMSYQFAFFITIPTGPEYTSRPPVLLAI